MFFWRHYFIWPTQQFSFHVEWSHTTQEQSYDDVVLPVLKDEELEEEEHRSWHMREWGAL
jgi:hypothetical protein